MKLNWFTRKGIFYLPASIVGWIILISGIIYAVYTFIKIDSTSHSVSDTLINFVFNLLIIGLVYSVIAWFTETRSKTEH